MTRPYGSSSSFSLSATCFAYLFIFCIVSKVEASQVSSATLAFLTPRQTMVSSSSARQAFCMKDIGPVYHGFPVYGISDTVHTSSRSYILSSTRLFQQGSDSEGEQESDDKNVEDNIELTTNSLDLILSRLTSCFPLFVLVSALVGLKAPSCLTWVNRGSLISIMLASVMMGTGMTLEKKDFTVIFDKNVGSVPAGVMCQYTIMPFAAWLVGRTMLLPLDPSLFLGLALVGCCPGGTASNLVSLIAGANVALSVLLTACSTVLAAFVTPLLVKLLVKGGSITVSGLALCSATARIVLLPVVLGMSLNQKAPLLAKYLSRFTPFCSVLLVALICGGVVADNAKTLLLNSGGSTMLPSIVASVLLLHIIGFLVGFLVPKFGLGYSNKTARTISIETGMQNSALAVVLARSVGAPPLASLPGALSATAHSCLGSILAAYWRLSDVEQKDEE